MGRPTNHCPLPPQIKGNPVPISEALSTQELWLVLLLSYNQGAKDIPGGDCAFNGQNLSRNTLCVCIRLCSCKIKKNLFKQLPRLGPSTLACEGNSRVCEQVGFSYEAQRSCGSSFHPVRCVQPSRYGQNHIKISVGDSEL